MWKWNVNSVVLLYYYLELASDKSTEIKTSFLGLEPCKTDTTLLLFLHFSTKGIWEYFCILCRAQFKFAGI